jgi:hypothetical protein
LHGRLSVKKRGVPQFCEVGLASRFSWPVVFPSCVGQGGMGRVGIGWKKAF